MTLDIKKYYNEPFYRNSIAIILNSVIGSLFGLLFWIVAARTMSSENIGLATAVISVSMLIVALSRLGMDTGLIRFLPISENKSDFYSSTLIITLIASIVLTAIFICGLDWFSPSLAFVKDGLFPIVLTILIALISINSIQYNAFIALRRGGLSFISNLLLGFRIPILFFVAFLGMMGIFFSYEIAYVLAFFFGVYIMHIIGVNFTFKFSMKPIKESFLYSLGNYTAGIVSLIATTIIPVLILNVTGAEDCAYFYVAYAIAGILFMIPGATSTSLFVEGSHNLPLKENTLKSIKLTLIILVPAIIAIFLFGDKILLLFSKEFSEKAFELLKLLVLSSLFSIIISIYTTIKRVQMEIKIINYINILSTVILVVAGYGFLVKYGLIGIGYAWIVNNAILSLIVVVLMFKKENWFDGYLKRLKIFT